MFDCHIHSRVSFDAEDTGENLARAAVAAGIKEICFTDHVDFDPLAQTQTMMFDVDAYSREYDHLEIPGLKIHRGMEFGLYTFNQEHLQERLRQRHYDYVLGSIHFVDDIDVYYREYWDGRTPFQAQRRFLEQTLACVQVHDGYDVLAHLTFLNKSPANPTKSPLPYDDHREIIDAILQELVKKGRGLEMNTSGVDRCGGFLPTVDYFRRFKELGGEIVTVGSDAHTANRVGQYCSDACGILKDIFGYVCTFENRQPVFHKL